MRRRRRRLFDSGSCGLTGVRGSEMYDDMITHREKNTQDLEGGGRVETHRSFCASCSLKSGRNAGWCASTRVIGWMWLRS